MYISLLVLCLIMITSENVTGLGEKARAMCQQYSQAVYRRDYSPILSSTRGVALTSQCGIVEMPLIVGGMRALPSEFPHMAAIGFPKGVKVLWLCGGSLISEQFVLTAAHCLTGKHGGPSLVKVGSTDVNSTDTVSQTILVASVVLHPLYRSLPKSTYHDIGLVKLVHRVVFTAHVRPACLNMYGDLRWNSVIATGYGQLAFKSSEQNSALMKVQLELMDSVMCNKSYEMEVRLGSLKQGIAVSQLCAGFMRGGRDTCQGDSGGPLQQVLSDPYCMYTIIGITSFGKFCGFKNAVAVYTRVASYIPWLEQQVWP